MSSGNISEEAPIEMVFQRTVEASSSEEPPMEEWSSLLSVEEIANEKMLLFKEGLYDPGSGEICTKYLRMSDSSVFRHVYYNYPSIKDPGILKALQDPEEKKIYPLDGQELYMDLCKEMNLCPVRSFYRGLLQDTIDLRYYGVNPVGVRAMGMSLAYNTYVTRLDLTSNFLSKDACYHLGQMLRDNVALQELVLSGCRIGPEGIRMLVVFLFTKPLNLLDLSRNELMDNGFEYLAYQISKRAIIKRLNLSYNDLGPAAATAYASALQTNNTVTSLDLSWNKLRMVGELLTQLGDSLVLEELNLSWNGIKGSKIFKKILTVPTLKVLNLSNNTLNKFAITALANGLPTARRLRILNVSYNPLTTADAFKLVNTLRDNTVKLTQLIMDNVAVDKKFVKEYQEVLDLSYRKKCKITYGDIIHNYVVEEIDLRDVVFKRLGFLSIGKKGEVDLGLYFLANRKLAEFMAPREMMKDFKIAGAPLTDEVVNALAEAFPGPKMEKAGVSINLTGVVDYVKRLWPDKKLPVTPPMTPKPEKKKK